MRALHGESCDATPFVPLGASLSRLQRASLKCQGCPLYKTATQTVFGEGPASARVVFIGEQPGDQEDKAGKPFVGPAGKILDKALDDAGIPRANVYVTNAVKHFKWTTPPGGGSRRLHQRPKKAEILACKPWLEAELDLIQPEQIVCLGSTAAQSLFGSAFRITKERGRPVLDSPYAPVVMATIHPSAILRTISRADRHAAYEGLVADLKRLEEASHRVSMEDWRKKFELR